MPRAPFLIAAAATLAALSAAAHLAVDAEPFADGPAVVLALSLSAAAIVASAATLVSRARWARRGIASLAVAVLALVAVSPLEPFSMAAAGLAGVALAGALGPWLQGWLRRLPAAEAPSRAGALALAGAALLPPAVAAVRWDGLGWGDWTLIAVTAASGWGLARAWAAGLWGVRLAVPAAGAAAAVTAGLPDGPFLAVLALAAATPSWHREVGLAVRPLVARSAAPIPPELADPALLRAAGFDEDGRPIEEAR